jgi:hypothetical protein
MEMPDSAFSDINRVALDWDRCEIQLIGRFLPTGLGGILYWNAYLTV